MALAHRFDPVTGAYITTTEDFGFRPANGTHVELPPRPWPGLWPRWTGTAWELVPDYRERQTPQFAAEDAQAPTEYWLPGDTWETAGRQMFTPGPLPDAALLERPEKPAELVLAEAKEAKAREVEAAYQSAISATLTMPQEAPTAQDVAVGAALLAANDAEGLEYVLERHDATRQTLLAQVAEAETAEAVEAITVAYAV